jgi:transposase-like protein
MTIGIVPRNRNLSKYFYEGGYGISEEEAWGDINRESITGLKTIIELSMEWHMQEYMGKKWSHHSVRNTYRNGYYKRDLLTSKGYLADIKVPRLRNGRINYEVINKYKRRSKELDELIMKMFLRGVSTRGVKDVLVPILGKEAVSAGLVSKISKGLNKEVEKYHSKQLEDKYEYLLLDGIYINAKNIMYKQRRCVLVAYGIWEEDGRIKKEIIDFEMTKKGESENGWVKFLNRLYYRGLEGRKLKLATIDGNKGLRNALDVVYPYVKVQRCWAHKMRNVMNRIPKRYRELCKKDANKIYRARDKSKAIIAYKEWVKVWKSFPGAVRAMEADIEELLNFYESPEYIRKKIRTTNGIERSFREVRRRTRPMSCFQNRESVERIVFAVFSRLNDISIKGMKIMENS